MNKETFSMLVRQHERSLYRISICITQNNADAEDAMQEALFKAWNARHALREERYFGTWLNRILINECKTLLRKRGRTMPTEAVDMPDTCFTAQRDEILDLRRALQALDVKYRLPLVLTELEGYSFRETAELLRLPVGTTKTRVARAKQKIRQEMES